MTLGEDVYYYVLNVQGDVMGLVDGSGTLMITYYYEGYGKCFYLSDTSDKTATMSANNHLLYRSYLLDKGTGLYYLQSRYYDPARGRFLNADAYASTGQGIISNNMFAYCGNNPVHRVDPSGGFWLEALIAGIVIIACAVTMSGCSGSTKPAALPYDSADAAATAFAEEIYSTSSFIRHEYSTEIYSRTVNGVTSYGYTTPRVGEPHRNVAVPDAIPNDTTLAAIAHTHPNSNEFSPTDKNAAKGMGVNSYIVGPSLELQVYSINDLRTTPLWGISPIPLTDIEKERLVMIYQASWDVHCQDECGYGCNNMPWPTP